MSKGFHLHNFLFSLLNLLYNVFYNLWLIRYFLKIDTVWHLQFDSLIYGFFNVFIVAESLPLCINRVDRPTWKDTSLDKLTPIHRVFCPLLWIFGYNIIYFDYFSNSELWSAEWNMFASFNNLISNYVFATIKDHFTSNRINNPLEAYYEPLTKLFYDLPIWLIVVGVDWTLRQDLHATAFNLIDTDTSKVMNQLLQSFSSFTFRYKHH